MSSLPTEVSVNIRGLAVGGAGVGEVISQNDGRTDLLGITAFVPFSAAGEQVSARVVQRKERYVQTELVSVGTPSAERVEPRCPLFTQCGGCELQHMRYEEQLRAKFEMIQGALRAGKLAMHHIEKLGAVRPGDPFNYRRRVSLHIDQTGKIGFYRESSRSVVATDHCPVAVDSINAVLKNLGDFGREVKGRITSVLLEADNDGVVAVLKTPYDLASGESRALLDTARKFFPNALLMAGEKEIGGYGRQILELPLNDRATITLRVPAGYFSQVNSGINAELVGRAVELAAPVSGTRVYDLYSGAGNFALPLARAGAKVTAVECDKRLVALGRENAARYGLQRQLEFYESSVEKFFVQMSKLKAEAPELVVADPPRSGLGSLAGSLGEANRLILVSCHLPSFVRDAKNLTDRGWEIREILPFDMFAQTSYVEILSSFSRPGA